MMMTRFLSLALLLVAAPVHAADFGFCWIGGGGYTMIGRMSFPDALLALRHISEHDVERFKISGYHEGRLIGTWDKDHRAPSASWRLNFSPLEERFLTPADLGVKSTQEWNANGFATDCGPTGFGFNAGDYAQDFCLHGEWIEASGIAPDTLFFVSRGQFDAECRAIDPLVG